MFEIETVIIGAGVVGLAVARQCALAGQDTIVLEQHDCIGSETSSRNSEVIHAGIYYLENSLKAELCVRGKHMLYDYCNTHSIAHKRIGKLIVANGAEQIDTLTSILKKAEDNGVDDIEFIERDKIKQLEPALRADCALLSPSTGIIDSHGFMLGLQGDGEDHGMQIAFNTKVEGIFTAKDGGYRIRTSQGSDADLKCKNLFVCAGLHVGKLLDKSDIIHQSANIIERYAKGNYFKLAMKTPFSKLIYPVPEPGGLGIHLTLDIGGQARFGPDVEWQDDIYYPVDPERSKSFYPAIRAYWPDLPDGALYPDYSGVRPKLGGSEDLASDFELLGERHHGQKRLVILRGIESPGLTSSLAIAEYAFSLLEQ